MPCPRPLRRLLIVAPHFPPVNAPDMQRVRMSLPHYRSFGWDPIVLTVDAARQPEPADALLSKTVPSDIPVIRTGALPLALTGLFGIGNVAIRAYGHLLAAGLRIIREAQIDLVFFSTTMFLCMPLGRVWQRQTKTPFVLDLQDPWASDYEPRGGAASRKYRSRTQSARAARAVDHEARERDRRGLARIHRDDSPALPVDCRRCVRHNPIRGGARGLRGRGASAAGNPS